MINLMYYKGAVLRKSMALLQLLAFWVKPKPVSIPAQPRIPDPKRVEAGKKAAATRQRRDALQSALDTLGDFLSVTKFRVNKKRTGTYSGYHIARPRDFNRIEPWVLCQLFPEFYPDYERIVGKGIGPGDLERPMDVSAMVDFDKEGGISSETEVAFRRFRQVGLKEVRGRVAVYMPYMVEERTAWVDKARRTGEPVVLYFGSNDAVNWFGIGNHMIRGPMKDSTYLEIAYGLSYTRQSQWLIGLQRDRQPAILLPTDPVGVREIFRMRDIPEGKKRRASLIGWVDAHYRKKHDDPTAEIYVRKHLRGGTRFVWNGLACSINPPRRASVFSQRPDLVQARDEASTNEPRTAPLESILTLKDIPENELARIREGLVNEELIVTPANKIGSWVTISRSDDNRGSYE